MSEPSEDPLCLIYPIGFEDEASFYGEEAFPSVPIPYVVPTNPNDFKVNESDVEAFILATSAYEVPLEVWCNWKFNAKKFTITTNFDQVDGFYYGGVNTYESGANEELAVFKPVPQYSFVGKGIMPSGIRQFQHQYFEPRLVGTVIVYDGTSHTFWRNPNSPPFGMFIHKGKAYISLYKSFDFYGPVVTNFITKTQMSFTDEAGPVTVDLIETYY